MALAALRIQNRCWCEGDFPAGIRGPVDCHGGDLKCRRVTSGYDYPISGRKPNVRLVESITLHGTYPAARADVACHFSPSQPSYVRGCTLDKNANRAPRDPAGRCDIPACRARQLAVRWLVRSFLLPVLAARATWREAGAGERSMFRSTWRVTRYWHFGSGRLPTPERRIIRPWLPPATWTVCWNR
jgi:hypothetical protein